MGSTPTSRAQLNPSMNPALRLKKQKSLEAEQKGAVNPALRARTGGGVGSSSKTLTKQKDTVLPANVSVRMCDKDVPVEAAVAQSALREAARQNPPLQLATDVVIATPHGFPLSKRSQVSVPLRGPFPLKHGKPAPFSPHDPAPMGKVVKVLYKADERAPWTVMSPTDYSQFDGASCQLFLKHLCFFALLKELDTHNDEDFNHRTRYLGDIDASENLLSIKDEVKTEVETATSAKYVAVTRNYYAIADKLATKSPEQVEAYWLKAGPEHRAMFDKIIAERFQVDSGPKRIATTSGPYSRVPNDFANGVYVIVENKAKRKPAGTFKPEVISRSFTRCKPAPTVAEKEALLEQLRNDALETISLNDKNLGARAVLDPAVAQWMTTLTTPQLHRLAKCTRAAVADPACKVGVYAMQPYGYDEFAPFFDHVCDALFKVDGRKHGHGSNWDLATVDRAGKSGPLPPGQVLNVKPMMSPGCAPMTRARLGRNLVGFPLAGHMTRLQRVQAEVAMLKGFEKLLANKAFGGKVYSVTPHADWAAATGEATNPNLISPEKFKNLVLDHVMFGDTTNDPSLAAVGIADDWPAGRGCYRSADGKTIIWYGEEDHLRFMCMGKETIINQVFDRLHAAVELMDAAKGVDYATSEKYGYVSSSPLNLGTGLHASVLTKQPNLTVAEATEAAKGLGVDVRRAKVKSGQVIDLSTSSCIFTTEAEIIAALYDGITALGAKEKATAAKAKEAEDKAQRQAALANNSAGNALGTGLYSQGTLATPPGDKAAQGGGWKNFLETTRGKRYHA